MTRDKAFEALRAKRKSLAFKAGWAAFCYSLTVPQNPLMREGYVAAQTLNDNTRNARPTVAWLED